MAHPKERLVDPLDQWEADAKFARDAHGSCEARCQHCSTRYRMIGDATFAMLRMTRDLGRGESPLDPVWLAQSGLEMEAEMSKTSKVGVVFPLQNCEALLQSGGRRKKRKR